MSTEVLNQTLKQFLLQNITIQVEQRTVRKGKLKMFSLKQFYCKLTLDIGKGETRHLELPYPFAVTGDDKQCLFDYKLTSFVHPSSSVSSKIKFLNNKNASKFYDKVVSISVI